MKKCLILLVLINISQINFCNELNYFPNYDELHKITNLSRAEITDCIEWIKKIEYERVYGLGKESWQNYYPVLSNLINKFKLKVGAEVGVAFGNHSVYMLLNTQIEKLYSIDSFKGWPPCQSPKASQYYDILYYKVKHTLSSFGERSQLIRSLSVNAAQSFVKNQLDFIFIDATHSYEELKQDLDVWFDKIRPGGLMAGDDYTKQFPGVIKAVNEFFGKKNIKVYQAKDHPRIWYIIKP